MVFKFKGGICFRVWSRVEESRVGWVGKGEGSFWGMSKGVEILFGFMKLVRVVAEALRFGYNIGIEVGY